MKRIFAIVLCMTACAPPAVRVVEPEGHAPLFMERIALPAKATAAWVSPSGGALVALRDGRVVALDDTDHLHAIARDAGDAVFGFADRGGGVPMALAPSGVWLFDRDRASRAALPDFLSGTRAVAPIGSGVLWATRDGLIEGDGARWAGVSIGDAMHDVTSLAAAGRDAWVLDGTTLRRVRVDDARATWSEWLGGVHAIAPLDASRVVASTDAGVAFVGDGVRVDRAGTGLPDAIAGSGGFAWVAWNGRVLRSDGARWEALARGLPMGETRIAVDASGATALVIDASGGLVRIDAAEALRLAGVSDGARVMDTRVELEALTTRSTSYTEVAYFIDEHPLVTRKEAPWGWGDGGERARDLREIELGSHVVRVEAKTRLGVRLQRTLRFTYASPFGRVPSYARDIAPIFAARCSRCHDHGVARDLATYERLRDQAPLVRASVREARMPPDLLLDSASVAIVTAWVDGDSPP